MFKEFDLKDFENSAKTLEQLIEKKQTRIRKITKNRRKNIRKFYPSISTNG